MKIKLSPNNLKNSSIITFQYYISSSTFSISFYIRYLCNDIIPRFPLSVRFAVRSLFRCTQCASDADERMVFPCGESSGIYFRDGVTYSRLSRSMTVEAGARIKVIYHSDILPPRYSDEGDKLRMRDMSTEKRKNNKN